MVKEIKKTLKYNFFNLLKFEFIFKLLTVFIFSPFFLWIFQFIMKLSGYSYLTKENFLPFLLNPISIVMLLLLFLFLTFYSLFDIGVVIQLIDSSYQKREVKLSEVMRSSFQKSLRVFSFKNFLFVFFILFLIPFLHVGVGISLFSAIKIPEFILDFIRANATLSILYCLVLVLLLVLFFRWIYSLSYYFLEDCSFLEAAKKSSGLGKGKHFKDFFTLVVTQALLAISHLLLILLLIVLLVVIYHCLHSYEWLNSIFIAIGCLIIFVSFLIYTIVSSSFSYIIICLMFYQHKEDHGEKIKHLSFSKISKKEKKKPLLTGAFVLLVVISFSFLTYQVLTGKFNLNIEYVRTMEVTAHRGASVLYPENTMSAFVGAKELGADWIELDVQQTKDREIIVLHDTNFKRTAGVSLNTWEATLEEVKKLDVGSFKDKRFQGEKVPTLEEVIVWAKENHMKLNIELKPTGNEKDFEKDVAEIILKYHFENDCVITSQVYEVLENFKKVNSNILTVYVTALAYGDVTQLDAADYFSVEASSITKSMVSTCHNEGKQIYAWTVNTDESILKMIDMNVDNIITDDPTLAKELIYSSKTSNILAEVIEGVERLF